MHRRNTNTYQCIGSINFEGNTVAYLKCFTGVIKINDGNVQHYRDNILNSNQFMSTTHALFYMSTSYLESENEGLKYALRIHLQKQIQGIILGQSEVTSTFISG